MRQMHRRGRIKWHVVRYVFASVGIIGSETALWVAASSVNGITVAFAVMAAVPFVAYALATKSKLGSAFGGPLLLSLPLVAYVDTYFGGPAGASFAFATVPIMNLFIYGMVVLLDAVAHARESRAVDQA